MSERTHEMNVFLQEIKEKLKDEPKLYSLFDTDDQRDVLVFQKATGGRELGYPVFFLVQLLMAVPGLVLGLSFVLAFKGTALYGTVWILILAGVLHFFTTPYNLLYQSLQKLSSELESVGSTLGIPPLRLIFDVLLPQCAGTLADMAAYFFVSSTVTISAAAFLSTASTRPLALLVVQYSDQLNLSGAAYLSFLILAVNLLARAAAALVRRLVRR